MIELATFIHYATVALAVSINAVGVSLGEGFTSMAALDSSNQQPQARALISRMAIIGMAFIETAAILGSIIAMMLLLGPEATSTSWYTHIATIGIGLAMCVSGLVIGIVSALPAQAACHAVARQPFFGSRILGFMLMTQALIQTPIISGLIVAFCIRNQALSATHMADCLRLIASGLCIGVGSIGPALGLAYFARTACQGLGINRHAYNKLLSFTLVSQAIIETPVLFSLTISLILLFVIPPSDQLFDGIACIAAGLCCGIGTLGPGISSGKAAGEACRQIAYKPHLQPVLARLSMVAQGLIETCAIYAVLIAIMLIFI